MSTPESALTAPTSRGGRASGALLKLQADERLVAHIRRGNEAAFEVLVQRYHVRLLAFCRHMLGQGARRDAEDVLQEVFTSAYRAMLGDTRPINVRPWLYRIARNRCLNHLRRDPMPSIEGMELTVVDERIGTAETVHQRAEVRQLLSDIQNLPETQRTAILLREIDDLSYEQIAMAMDNTVAAVKSLLVRARVGLAEAAESRRLSCDEVRFELGQHAEGLVDKLTPPSRRHLKECKSCSAFQQDLKDTNKALAMLAPAFGLVILVKSILAPLGGASHAGTGAAGGAAAGAAASGGGLISVGGGILSAKTFTGLAAAVAVTGAAVEVKHVAAPTRQTGNTQQARTTQTPPQQPTRKAPIGGVAAASVIPALADAADAKDGDKGKTQDEPEATTPPTTTAGVLGTTPEASTPATGVDVPLGTTPAPTTVESHTGSADLPGVEDHSDSTRVQQPIRLPVPIPASLRPAPSSPATPPAAASRPTPAESTPAAAEPAPAATPVESTPAPAPTTRPAPEVETVAPAAQPIPAPPVPSSTPDAAPTTTTP